MPSVLLVTCTPQWLTGTRTVDDSETTQADNRSLLFVEGLPATSQPPFDLRRGQTLSVTVG